MNNIEIPKEVKFLIYIVGFVLIFAVIFSGIQLINPEIEMEVSGKCHLGDMNIDYVKEHFTGTGNIPIDIGKNSETTTQIDYVKDASCEGTVKYKGSVLALRGLSNVNWRSFNLFNNKKG